MGEPTEQRTQKPQQKETQCHMQPGSEACLLLKDQSQSTEARERKTKTVQGGLPHICTHYTHSPKPHPSSYIPGSTHIHNREYVQCILHTTNTTCKHNANTFRTYPQHTLYHMPQTLHIYTHSHCTHHIPSTQHT